METIEQYLSLLKELNNIEVRINRLMTIFQQNGRTELDDLLISGIISKAEQLSAAAALLSTIEQVVPPVNTDTGIDSSTTNG